ncbi:hypothetical protein MNV49_002245 [Pseudohyphozyma bogoriensis]|nr:hypothetical protein MNV49_002245 [Pseudohyphozyma bogoriensis]
MKLSTAGAVILLAASVHAWGGAASTGTAVDPASTTSLAAPAAASAASPAISDVPVVAAKPTGLVVPPYTKGPEYKYGQIRIRPYELIPEAVIATILFFYVLSSLILRRTNAARAKAFFEATKQTWESEFAAFGMSGGKLFEKDGGSEFVAFGTGRRGVEGVQVNVKTMDHDLVQALYHQARSLAEIGYNAKSETITLAFVLPAPIGTPGSKTVFSIVKRSSLKTLLDSSWDLRTFTTTSENALLPPSVIALAESGDQVNAFVKSNDVGLRDVVGSEWFESFVLSDMPVVKPDEYSENVALPTDQYRMVLTLRLPPSSRMGELNDLIKVACNVADIVNAKKIIFPSVALSKIKKRREQVLEELQKVLKEEKAAELKEQQEALVAKKKKAEKDALEAKIKSLPKAERLKLLEKEKEKERKSAVKKAAKQQQKK